MTLTPELLTAMAIAVASLITAMGAVVVNIIMAQKVSSVKQDVGEVKVDVADVKTKAEVIAGHVNSELTAGKGREATLKRENELLREMVEEGKKATALLAQSAATKLPTMQEHSTSEPVQVEVVNKPKVEVENKPNAPVPIKAVK